jgi:2-keto-3-deoxy-6-phosphogluconate aldolase
MSRKSILDSIIDIGVVPVVRTGSAESAVRAVEAVFQGGIRAAEITMTSSAIRSRWERERCSIRKPRACACLRARNSW